MKLSGLYFVEKLDKHSAPKRYLHYMCSKEEKANLTLDYDKWCIGWVLYELTTRGVENAKNAKFTFTSPQTYLTGKDLDAHVNPKYSDFNLILKEYVFKKDEFVFCLN